MTQSKPADRKSADLLTRSDDVCRDSAHLRMRSDVARRTFGSTGDAETRPDVEPPIVDAGAERQRGRCHIIIVNTDPAFLDAARVLLQGDQYNVTTTNLVPRTYEMILAAQADALVIDLKLHQAPIWSLVAQLQESMPVDRLPMIFTATDQALLDEAERKGWPMGGRFLLLKPFDPNVLGDVIYALIGPA